MPEQTKELPQILTVQDAAQYLQRCTKTIYKRITSGEIKSFRDCRGYRIRREWLLEYEQNCMNRGAVS